MGLRLSSNATTGFKWQHKLTAAKGAECFEVSDSKYQMKKEGYSPPGGMMTTGVGGTRTMVIEPKIPSCTSSLWLKYAQPWNFPGFDKLSVGEITMIRISTEPATTLVWMDKEAKDSSKAYNVSVEPGK